MATINLIEVNNWADAARFGVAPDGYAALSLGSAVIGWTSLPLVAKVGPDTQLVKAVVGHKVYDFELNALLFAWDTHEVDVAYDIKKRVQNLAHIVLNLPVGSVDLTTHGTLINYTKRTAETFYSALANYFLLQEALIQSELHQKTKPEAMEMLLTLGNSHYPAKPLSRLTWRGTLLHDLLQSNPMMWFEKGVGSGLQHASLSSLADHAAYFMDYKNVFFLKAESDDEYRLGAILFNEKYLHMFLRETTHEIIPEYDKVIFLVNADNHIAEWIAGTTITVREMHEMVLANGYTLSD